MLNKQVRLQVAASSAVILKHNNITTMESQLQKPEYDHTASQRATAVLEPAPLSKLSPPPQIREKWWWHQGTQVSVWLAGLPENLGEVFNQYKQATISVALILAVAIALRVILAVMDALNDIPLLSPTFELIGISYYVWFVNRYLLRASTRQELFLEIQRVLKAFTRLDESEQYKPGKIVPTSDRYEAINSDEGSVGREVTATKEEHFLPTPESGMHHQGKDVIRTKDSEQLYKPGEIVPTSGQYEVINPDGGSSGREVTATKGEHFPPTPESGMRYMLVDETKHKGNQELLNKLRKDVIRTEDSEQLYKPGEIVPQSGQYEVINPDGGSAGREVTSTKGEHFPPTSESGMHYTLVDPTQHTNK